MPASQDAAERLGDDPHPHQFTIERQLMLDIGSRQNDVQSTARQFVGEPGADRPHADVDVGRVAPDLPDQAGEHGELWVVGRCDCEAPPRQGGMKVGFSAEDAFECREAQRQRWAQGQGARRRMERIADPDQQRVIEAGAQGAQRVAHGRLSQAERVGRAGHAPVFHQGVENQEQTEVAVGHMTWAHGRMMTERLASCPAEI